MSDLNLRSIDMGFCVRCQDMAVEVPDDATVCEYDLHAPCVDDDAEVHGGDGRIECGTRDDLVSQMRALGFRVSA